MTRTHQVLIAAFAVLMVGGGAFIYFSSENASTSRSCAERQPKISAFGDSLVAGYGSTVGGGFVQLISAKAGVPILNLGKNGDTTSGALERIDTVMEAHPDITLVLLGGNDALQQVSRAQTEENLGKIISTIQAGGSRVTLLGVIGGIPDPYAGMYKRLADQYNVTYVPNVLSGIIGHADLMSDSIHPNDAGYQKIADRVVPVLEDECGKVSK